MILCLNASLLKQEKLDRLVPSTLQQNNLKPCQPSNAYQLKTSNVLSCMRTFFVSQHRRTYIINFATFPCPLLTPEESMVGERRHRQDRGFDAANK